MGSHQIGPTPDRDRDLTADDRDAISDALDQTADERDRRAALRDARAALRDAASQAPDREAVADRHAAMRDRLAARCDRLHARDDRAAAKADRLLAAQDRAELFFDDLTGFYRRVSGLVELRREVLEAERTGKRFVLGFLDVDGLKAVNDGHGHEVGDATLREIAHCLRGVFREYDVFVRSGGDEFICGFVDLPIADVAERFDEVNDGLRARDHATVSVGLAERAPGEELESLIKRADAAMYEARGQVARGSGAAARERGAV